MEPVSALFGLGCAITVYLARRDRSRLSAAALCLFGWAVSNIAWQADALRFLPAWDLVVAIVALDLYRADTERWKALFLALSVGQLCLHVMDEITDGVYVVGYINALNITFAAQLTVVGIEGNHHDWLDRLRRFRRVGMARDGS